MASIFYRDCLYFAGATISEGGFKKNSVSSASLVDAKTEQKDGKPYYKLEVLTRAGKHNIKTKL